MKKLFVIMGLLGIVLTLQAQYGIAPGSVSAELEEPLIPQNYPHLLQPEEDTFATYIYTFGDIVIFSYEDSARAEITDQSGTNIVWSGNLNADEYVFRYTGEGIYQVRCNKEFSVLIGDPLSQIVQGWYAVDQNSRPLSNKFLTVMQGSWVSGTHVGIEKFCVFAYYDNTDVTVKDLDAGTIIWTGTLDSLQHWDTRRSVQRGLPVSVEATKEVSVLSYGDCGYYAPAFNGTFTGRDFITYSGDMGATEPWPQALKVIPWEDNTDVVVTNLDDLTDTLWKFHVDSRGDIQSRNFARRFLKVHADKDISCALVPGQGANYYHLVRCIDRDGLGIGREFFIPTCQTTADLTAKLDIFAFYDNTDVEVYKMPDANTPVWSGVLQKGGHHRVVTDYGVYKVVGSRGVAIIESDGDLAGADFLPLWFAIHPSVSAYPSPQLRETECLVPTSQTEEGVYEVDVENNGNIYDVINIFTENSKAPAFTTDLSDEYGGILPDVDGDGNPDTDTLTRGQSFIVLADVIPADTLPFGYTDTCFFTVISSRDTTKLDTALLITRILPVGIMLDPDTVTGTVYPSESVLLDVDALNTSLYREDTVNLTWSSNKDTLTWSVDMFGLDDSDGDGAPDVEPVPVDQVPVAFQVRVGAPDSAMAGDSIIIELVGASVNYPYDLDPSTNRYPADTVTDTTVLIVVVEPAPDILIRPDYVDSVPAGQSILYLLEVLNFGNGPDVPDITYEDPGRSDWLHRLVAKDMISDLPDSDGDGIPDVDTVPGKVGDVPGMDSFYLEVRPPYTALSGLADTTILRATSSINDTATDIAIIETITRGIVALDIEPDTGTTIGPGDTAYYVLRVTNDGGAPDTVTIGSYVLPDLGWYYEFSLDGQSLQVRNDGYSLGVVDSSETIEVELSVWPHEALGELIEEFDTTVTEPRVVWVRTCYTTDLELHNDSVFVTTVFEPLLDIHNYPNPFSGSTTFAFSIPRAGHVTLRIYNRAGEHIRTLIDEDYPEGGLFEEYWDGLTDSGHRPSPGVYIYSLQWQEKDAGGLFKTQKVVKKALMQP